MKISAYVFRIVLVTLFTGSCIGEDYLECPDFGKYRVLFSSKDSQNIGERMYISLIYKDENNFPKEVGSERYEKEAGKSDFISDKVLRLIPGSYRFCSLSSTSPIIIDSGKYKMRNRELYLFADTLDMIIKRYENRVILNFHPVNSLIQAQCILDPELSSDYEIRDFSISSPDDRDVSIDPENGSATYSERITEFFDYFKLNEEGTLFGYYCVPFRGGCYVNFRITLILKPFSSSEGKDSLLVLKNRIFLKSDIEQGKVYRFTFDVSALEINWKSTTVTEWDEYNSDREIPVI